MINCDRGTLADVGCALNLEVPAYDFVYDTIRIPSEYLQFIRFEDMSIGNYEYSVR